MDASMDIANIKCLPNELLELILDKIPIQTLLDCNNCTIIDNYVIKKYLSLNNILKYQKELINHKNYVRIVINYNFKHVERIVDYYMSIINSNGGLVKHKNYNGEPVDMFLLRFKCHNENNCFELISKFVDNDKESEGKCFGYSGWLRTVYLRQELINRIEYLFRSCAYLSPFESIEIVKINYPNGYNKSINGIDYISEHKETIMIKFI
jgi:hypothetical protein